MFPKWLTSNVKKVLTHFIKKKYGKRDLQNLLRYVSRTHCLT